MENHDFLRYAVLLLSAAVIAVPLAKRLQLGAVLGYLVAGAIIGPAGFGWAQNPERIASISELGVVLLLFVIGLELSPQRLWVMRRSVFGIGSLQVVVTSLVIGAIAAFGFGIDWRAALVVGMGLALSSNAFGLQLLAERKELTSAHGRLGFAILLFQDLAAIPLQALIPVLGSSGQGAAMNVVAALRIVAVIALVIVTGRYLLRPVFRAVAAAQLPEVITATALLVVLGTAWLKESAGISMALGAFLAGLLLADSEYRHALEAQLDPFKGLLLGLFFTTVGMTVDLQLLIRQPWLEGGLVVAKVAVKAAVIFGVGRTAGRLNTNSAASLAVLLAAGGEFAFVVFNLA